MLVQVGSATRGVFSPALRKVGSTDSGGSRFLGTETLIRLGIREPTALQPFQRHSPRRSDRQHQEHAMPHAVDLARLSTHQLLPLYADILTELTMGVGRRGRSSVGWSAKLDVGNRRSVARGALDPGGRSSVSHSGATSRAITGSCPARG